MNQHRPEFSIDAHVASALIRDAEIRRRLHAAVSPSGLRYVITDMLARELAPLAPEPEAPPPGFVRYADIQGFWFSLGFGSFLRTPLQLQQFEVAQRRAAIGDERFLSIVETALTHSNAHDERLLESVSERDRVAKAENEKLASDVKNWMHNLLDNRARSAKKMLDNFDTLRNASFTQVLTENHVTLGLSANPSNWPSIQQVPILFRFCSYLTGTMIIRFRENRRVSGSDMGDATHYALAGYVDLYVSDDKLFNDIYELIPGDKPFSLMTSMDFCSEFLP